MRRAARRDAGVALLITLLVTVLIVTIVFEIFRAGARAARTGAYSRDSIRAALLAEAGVSAARIALEQDAKDNSTDTLDEIWSRPAPPIELGEGVINVTIEDEERKLNLNRLVGTRDRISADEQRLAVFRRLLGILDIDIAVADAVVDWLDSDDSTRVGGAESAYYESLPYPYRAKNHLFDTVEELRLVRGVTADVYDKLRPFVTALPVEFATVNINTAPKEILMALSAGGDPQYEDTIDQSAAEEIIAYRESNPFGAKTDFKQVGTALERLYLQNITFQSMIDVKSSAFRVRSSGDFGGTIRVVDAVGVRSGNTVQWRSWRLE